MAKNISVNINAKDNTKATLDSIKKNVSGLGSSFKSLTALFAAEKLKQLFTDAIKSGTEADSSLKASFTSIGDAYRGFQVATARAFLGNEQLMSSLKSVILSVGPAVIKSFQLIVNTVLLVINGYRQLAKVASIAWNAIRGKDNDSNWKALDSLAEQSKVIRANFAEIWKSNVTITPIAAAVKTLAKAGPVVRDTSAARAALARRSAPVIRDVIETDYTKPDIAKRIDVSREDQQAIVKRSPLKDDALAMLKEIEGIQSAAENVVSGLAATLADGIANAFAGAFSGGNIGSIIKDFGKVILSGIGSVFVQLGKTLINFGALMVKLKAALANVLTAGPASIAIGVALLAIGGVLNGIAAGGGSAASYGASNSVGNFNSTQQSVSANGQGDATIYISGGLLDMSNPEQARALANAIGTLSGRRVNIQTGA